MFGKWMQKLKEKLNQAGSDNRGSAFIAVIIGVMALMIIGATILSLATNYVITVITDQKLTENFYETEGAVGEIRSGLEEICGKANVYAYMEVINHYNSTDRTEDNTLSSTMHTMKEKFAVKYLTGIVAMLKNPNLHELDNSVNTVDNRLDLDNGWDGSDQPEKGLWKSFKIDSVKQMVARPSTVGSTYSGNELRYGFRVIREDEEPDGKIKEMYLIISGLKVDYTDVDGYRTVVQTDIRVDVPEYSFEGNDTIDEMKKYIVICDEKLSVATNDLSGSTYGIGFTGNVYAGGTHDGSGNYGTGIDINSKAQNIIFDSDKIISRGDLTIQDKAGVSIVNTDGELWLKNIVLASGPDAPGGPGVSLQTKLELFTNAYILDDLSIDNNNAYVDLAGNYYGYSYNVNNTVTDPDATSSEYSSAILVNGRNTMLKSDRLKKLVLAGRTFVSRYDNRVSGVPEPDISMGESLAVKSNQIAYLVPDECIIPMGQGHNPLLVTEVRGDNYMDSINLDQLKQTMAWPYLNESKPVIANYNNDGGYVYLYLNFANQNMANQYFSKFYSEPENKAILDERAETYISTMDNEGMKLGAQLYLLAGNIIHNYYAADGSVKQTANYFDGAGNPNPEMLRDGAKRMENYVGKQLALVNSGYHTGMASRYELLSDSDKSQLVRDRIINFGQIDADAAIMDIRKDNTDAVVGGELYITPGNYTVDGSIPRGLIISGGSVTVQRNFEGLILAKNGVFVQGSNIQLTANSSLVGSLIEMIRNDPDLSKYFYDLDADKDRTNKVAECIRYENWERDNDSQLGIGTE